MPVQGFGNGFKIFREERTVQLQQCELQKFVEILHMLGFPVCTSTRSWTRNHSRSCRSDDVVVRRDNVGNACTFFRIQVKKRLERRFLSDGGSWWHDSWLARYKVIGLLRDDIDLLGSD
jgi:hypothetical protein